MEDIVTTAILSAHESSLLLGTRKESSDTMLKTVYYTVPPNCNKMDLQLNILGYIVRKRSNLQLFRLDVQPCWVYSTDEPLKMVSPLHLFGINMKPIEDPMGFDLNSCRTLISLIQGLQDGMAEPCPVLFERPLHFLRAVQLREHHPPHLAAFLRRQIGSSPLFFLLLPLFRLRHQPAPMPKRGVEPLL